MLQIIACLMSIHLIVKGFELLARKSVWASVGAIIAFIAAPIFLYLTYTESVATITIPLPEAYSAPPAFDTNAGANDAMNEANGSIANADAALANAQAAMDNASR